MQAASSEVKRSKLVRTHVKLATAGSYSHALSWLLAGFLTLVSAGSQNGHAHTHDGGSQPRNGAWACPGLLGYPRQLSLKCSMCVSRGACAQV